jgi:peptidoglycan hydrolase CwlO-like protein
MTISAEYELWAHAEIERLREQVQALQLVATSHEPEALRLQAEIEQLQITVRELTALLAITQTALADRYQEIEQLRKPD